MRGITSKDFNKLNELYTNGDYNSYKVVWSLLNEALYWVKSNGGLTIESSNLQSDDELFNWVQIKFPNIYPELRKGALSILNDSDEFPRFKQNQVNRDFLKSGLDFKLIKKIKVWGQEIKLKQTFQRIEDLQLDDISNKIEFRLSNNAYLSITGEGKILNSDFSLVFKTSQYIEVGHNGSKTWFKLDGDTKVVTPETSIDVSSIYLNAIEIQK